jgi:hypothetical protein
MRRVAAEAWVHSVLDALVSGRPVEDSLVELKSIWPTDFASAARRVAGHANSAGGEPIMWIVGADEKARKILGASSIDTATWYAQLKAQFADEWAPALQIFNIPRDGTVVTAVIFDTDGVPFVVKAPQGRTEIPWRDGTGVRSARRSEMFALLAEQAHLPDFQILFAEATAHPTARGTWSWSVWVDLYVAPRNHSAITFPLHEMQAWIQRADGEERIPIHPIEFRHSVTRRNDLGDSVSAHRIEIDGVQVTVTGPGLIVMQTQSDGPLDDTSTDVWREFHLVLVPAGGHIAAGLRATLASVAPKVTHAFTWRYEREKPTSG